MTDSNELHNGLAPLAEDSGFEPVDKSYRKVVFARICLAYLVLMACALLILTIDSGNRFLLLTAAEAVLAVCFALNLAAVRKIYDFKGYALGPGMISYRSGIVFPKVITIPIGKIQQVSIRLNPVSRIFGLYYLDVVNGAQGATDRLTIPGLSKERAEELKSLLITNACDDNE